MNDHTPSTDPIWNGKDLSRMKIYKRIWNGQDMQPWTARSEQAVNFNVK